jgi:hypothetical protein
MSVNSAFNSLVRIMVLSSPTPIPNLADERLPSAFWPNQTSKFVLKRF